MRPMSGGHVRSVCDPGGWGYWRHFALRCSVEGVLLHGLGDLWRLSGPLMRLVFGIPVKSPGELIASS